MIAINENPKYKKMRQAFDSNEPELDENYSQSDMARALSWYNMFWDTKRLTGTANRYLKKNKINKVIPSNVGIRTAGAIIRLIERDQIAMEDNTFLKNWLSRLQDPGPVKDEVRSNRPAVTIQEATAIRLNEYITGLDNAFEDFIESKFKKKFNTKKYLANKGVKASYIQGMMDWAQSVYDEIFLSMTDKELKEGYSNLTMTQKKKILKFFNEMITELGLYRNAIKSVRKRKVVPASKIVSKLKYQTQFPGLKLVSEAPEKLVNAKEVWAYDTDKRVLRYYTSISGMTVKGTTLKGFDFGEQRKLRKPDEQLSVITKSRKGQWIKQFKTTIKTVVTTPNGRFNDSTIILKVW